MAPLQVMPMSKVRVISQIVAIAPSTPAAAARFVTTATSAKRPGPEIALSVEPGLKPNQPNHRIRTASPTSGIEWPGITFGLPSRPYLP